MRPRTASYCVFAKKTPMLSNRDNFRNFTSPDRPRVAIRSVLGETRNNLRVLVVETRHHSRGRQMDHAGASSSKFRDRARCAASPLEYRCPERLHHLNKASQLPTFDFGRHLHSFGDLRATQGVFSPPNQRIRDPHWTLRIVGSSGIVQAHTPDLPEPHRTLK